MDRMAEFYVILLNDLYYFNSVQLEEGDCDIGLQEVPDEKFNAE